MGYSKGSAMRTENCGVVCRTFPEKVLPQALPPQRPRLLLLTNLSWKQSNELNIRGYASICSPHLLLKPISTSWSSLSAITRPPTQHSEPQPQATPPLSLVSLTHRKRVCVTTASYRR